MRSSPSKPQELLTLVNEYAAVECPHGRCPGDDALLALAHSRRPDACTSFVFSCCDAGDDCPRHERRHGKATLHSLPRPLHCQEVRDAVERRGPFAANGSGRKCDLNGRFRRHSGTNGNPPRTLGLVLPIEDERHQTERSRLARTAAISFRRLAPHRTTKVATDHRCFARRISEYCRLLGMDYRIAPWALPSSCTAVRAGPGRTVLRQGWHRARPLTGLAS